MRALHEFGQRLARFFGIIRIRGTGVRCFALRRGRELLDARHAELLELFVFKETGFAQRVEQIFFDLANLNLPGDTDQRFPEIERRLLAVEARQTRHQLRRDQQHRIRELKRIAHQQPGMFGIRRRNEIQTHS